ncbi:hypothetical protein TanjilG_29939 [Lupinus angustifolius]|uniref:Glycosyltransferase n=1 Tax=Lupinus angustifolius TaxID=3871 RepID=A0A1J7H1C1_LUPAN|nr:PREDICTED: UDP-glycosyltransferase 74G1-like isoform X1 [Lupinus angustifolius]OIW06518.1 hypothetical protein TanjilG_29939 [Lupinus angustifolius]
MDKKIKDRRITHCLLLPYPAQGHINPILQFSKLLQQQGVKVTLVSTIFYSKNMNKVPSNISFETISDGFDKGGVDEADNYKAYSDSFRKVGTETLSELIEKLDKQGNHVDCIIYDPFIPWVIEVAKRFEIVGAAYFTQNMNVNSIYYHVYKGKLQVPIIVDEISLPSMPKLEVQDLPSFFLTYEEDPSLVDLLVDQFKIIEKADWILCNTFYELDKEIADWSIKTWPQFRTVGPNIPSMMFLDKQHKDDEDYCVSQFKSEDCIEWLNDKPKGSVIYVSFGSLASIDEDQMKEIAYGLKNSGNYFLWVVRASEEIKLPKDFEKKSNKGLVVKWCSQIKVLAHESLGCFITHCGWNSTLEALCLGVPLIAMPQLSDQTTNAKYIVDFWKIGIRAKFDEKKIVRQEVLNDCIREILENERGKEIKNNAMQLKNLAMKAINEGGSSHKNIKEFMNDLFPLEPTWPA